MAFVYYNDMVQDYQAFASFIQKELFSLTATHPQPFAVNCDSMQTYFDVFPKISG